MENQNASQNMNPVDYLNSISSAGPGPVSGPVGSNGRSVKPKSVWVIVGMAAGVILAVVMVGLNIKGLLNGGSNSETVAQEDDNMFEVVASSEPLPKLGAGYTAVGLYSENLVAATRKFDDKIVFLDTQYKVKFVLSDEYQLMAYEFHDGRIPVQCKQGDNAGKIGYLDTNGDLVIACKYSYASSFDDGVAGVIVRSDVQDGDAAKVLIGKINPAGELLESDEKTVNAAWRF